ncbi:MAG: hypothetical protein FWH27_02765 [Planctomycetaceae bacterium]|nr:hypothetical protein [Planctomycetaceae bacterium]
MDSILEADEVLPIFHIAWVSDFSMEIARHFHPGHHVHLEKIMVETTAARICDEFQQVFYHIANIGGKWAGVIANAVFG